MPRDMQNALRINQLKVLLSAIIWGASFVATKSALAEISPGTLIAVRFGMGVVVLALAAWRLRAFHRVSARDLLYLALLGFIGVAFHQALQTNGLRFTTATNTAWLVALIPVFTAILARVFLAERMGVGKVLGFVIALCGVILVVGKGASLGDTIGLPSTFGDVLELTSALNWAVFIVLSKPLLRRMQPTAMMAYVMFLGWLMVMPFFLADQGWRELGAVTFNGWLAIAFLGLFCSGLAYIFYYDGLAHIDASQVASAAYLQPLVTVLTAALILSEAITPLTILGGAAILFGVYLVNRAPTRSAVVEVTGASD